MQRASVVHDLDVISGRSLEDIVKDNPELLVFPNKLGANNDGIDKLRICSYSEAYDCLSTGNFMGFVGVNDTQLSIKSRFAKSGDDYFLHYMILKVFCPNILKLEHDTSSTSVFDFLMYMFPHFLTEAMSQGIYKEYRKFAYNDSRVRGTIDVSRHINRNIPFCGNIAYNTREYSSDNHLTQLIRHTIEHLKAKPTGKAVLGNRELQPYLRQIINLTPTYNHGDRRKILSANRREVHHPYFTKYTILQKLCVAILRHEELKYGTGNDKVYGILFDGAWLWEEFLNTIIKHWGFIHPENKTHGHPIHLFKGDKYPRYPDFYSDDCVIDAKYKHLGNADIARDDIHQIISYLHVLSAQKAMLAYPADRAEATSIHHIGTLKGMGGDIALMGLRIPQQASSFEEFIKQIENEVTILNNNISAML